MNDPKWEQAMKELQTRRATTGIPKQKGIDDYTSHLHWARTQCILDHDYTVLDVGCGDMFVKSILMTMGFTGKYFGLDAFPIHPASIKGKIEDGFDGKRVDTVIAFAVLDGVENLDKAMEQINHIATKSILILSGHGIPVDKYHTFEISWDKLVNGFPDFVCSDIKRLHPNVALFGYTRKDSHG